MAMKGAKGASLVFLTLAIVILSISLSPAAFAADKKAESWDKFVSCDMNGNEKSAFLLADDVYVKGGWFPLRANKQVSIYVMPNGLKIKDIKPENSIAGPVVQTVDGSGHLPITEIWPYPLKVGKYDVWVDVNQNGKLDDGDFFHFYFFFCFYFFFVIPESLMGSIGAVSAMIFGLAIFHVGRIRNSTKQSSRKY
jgi:hypothetical protein